MDRLDISQIKCALIAACDGIIRNEERLTELDSLIGDGDHGLTMKSGFSALKEMLLSTEIATVPELFRETGILLVRVMGGASGVLFGTLFIGGYEALQTPDSVNVSELTAFFRSSCEAISRRGRASRGDRTMLDALYPAVDAMCEARDRGCGMEELLLAAKNAALRGAKETEQMLPRKGRSRDFRDRSLNLPDPGAVSVSILFESISDCINSKDYEYEKEWNKK